MDKNHLEMGKKCRKLRLFEGFLGDFWAFFLEPEKTPEKWVKITRKWGIIA